MTTAPKATTMARVTTAMTPRKVSTPTATTTDVLVDDDDNIAASSASPPSIADFRHYKALKNQ